MQATPSPDTDASTPNRSSSYRFGGFVLDVSPRLLTREGEPITLAPKAFDMLVLLIEHRHRVMSKEELMTMVWRDAFVSEDSLSQLIFTLRRALGDDPGTPRFIATSHRRGYRFIADVVELPGPPQGEALPLALDSSANPPAADASAPVVQVPDAAVPVAPNRTGFPVPWLLLPIAIVLTAAVSWFTARTVATRSEPTVMGPIRAVQTAPAGTTFTSGGVLSPDGRFLTFAARDERSGDTSLWVRDLGSGETRNLADTTGAEEPFWAPDSRRIAFASNGKLRVADLQGSPVRTLASVGLGLRPGGGSWSTNGTILFAPRRSGLQAVSDAGGPIRSVTMLDPAAKESAHRLPRFLPDGSHFLYYIASADNEHSGTYVASLDGGSPVRLVDGSQATFADARLVYLRDGALMAQPFDQARARLGGEPVMLAKGVSDARTVSATGSVISFVESASSTNLVWFNRAGERLESVDSPAPLGNPQLTRDGKQVVGANNDQRGDHQGVWLADLTRRVSTRLTSAGIAPVPSPDNSRIVFTSDNAGGIRDLYVLDRQRGEEQPLLKSAENKLPTDWTRDGRYIVFVSTGPKTKQDLWVLPTFGDRKPGLFLATPFNEIQAQVSPDGKSIAYASDETGRWEVYLQSFPVAGNKQLVSVGGGGQPQWRGDGRELYYLALDRTLMTVTVSPGSPVLIAPPKPLFRTSVADVTESRNRFVPDASGQKFLVSSVDTTDRPEIVLLINSLAQ